MSNEKMRAEFEAKADIDQKWFEYRDGDSYSLDKIQHDWVLWQAAWQAARAQPAGEAVAWVVTVGDSIANQIGFFTDIDSAEHCRKDAATSKHYEDLFEVQPLYTAPPAQLPDAVALLREMEWQYQQYDEYNHVESCFYCPDCEEKRERGHAANCKLAAVLAALPAQVPDGWQLVPKMPTAEMLGRSGIGALALQTYHAMLAAAPQPKGDKK